MSAARPQVTYTGSKSVRPAGMHHVIQIVLQGDFENVMTWIIGVDEMRRFEAYQSGGDVHIKIY